MSGLGVSDGAFYRLQEAMIQRMAEMLISEKKAAVALSQVNRAQKLLTNRRIKHSRAHGCCYNIVV